MGIIDKIEEIRNKPESVRLRYVWIGVAICMVVIVAIWFFSMRELFSKTENDGKVFEDLKKSFEKSNEQMPSIKGVPDPAPPQGDTAPQEAPRQDALEKNEGFQENINASPESSVVPEGEIPSEIPNDNKSQVGETPGLEQ